MVPDPEFPYPINYTISISVSANFMTLNLN